MFFLLGITFLDFIVGFQKRKNMFKSMSMSLVLCNYLSYSDSQLDLKQGKRKLVFICTIQVVVDVKENI